MPTIDDLLAGLDLPEEQESPLDRSAKRQERPAATEDAKPRSPKDELLARAMAAQERRKVQRDGYEERNGHFQAEQSDWSPDKPLRLPRHEAFARFAARGATQREAMLAAGYKGGGHATPMAYLQVRQRVRYLQGLLMPVIVSAEQEIAQMQNAREMAMDMMMPKQAAEISRMLMKAAGVHAPDKKEVAKDTTITHERRAVIVPMPTKDESSDAWEQRVQRELAGRGERKLLQ